MQTTKINPSFQGEIRIINAKRVGKNIINEELEPIITTFEQDALIKRVCSTIAKSDHKRTKITAEDSNILNTLLSLITGKKIEEKPGKKFMMSFFDKFITYSSAPSKKEGSFFVIKF